MLTLAEEPAPKTLLLPPGERVRLAEGLLATVQEVDAEAEAAWDAAIKPRLAEIDQDTEHLIPAAYVFSEVRRLIQP